MFSSKSRFDGDDLGPPINLNNYKFCILWLPPNNPNCQVFFIFKDFLMSWKPGDMKFIKKEFRVEVEDTCHYLPLLFTKELFMLS